MEEEERKMSLEELQKGLREVKELAEKSRDQVKEIVERRPLESSALIFLIGFILGVLAGATSKRG